MSYYLKSVNFCDPQSIVDSDVTDLVIIAKNCVNIWNQEVPTYGNYDYREELGIEEELTLDYNVKSLVKICNSVYQKISTAQTEYEDKEYQENKLKFNERYKDSVIDEYIYRKKIYICDINTIYKYRLIEIYDSGQCLRYNPSGYNSDGNCPWWVEEFSFPYHGGDEESYYMKAGFSKFQQARDEIGYYIKYKWITIIIDDTSLGFTIARTAHA